MHALKKQMITENNTNIRFEYKFVIGREESSNGQLEVMEEEKQYGDIIILDCTENMNNRKTYY